MILLVILYLFDYIDIFVAFGGWWVAASRGSLALVGCG